MSADQITARARVQVTIEVEESAWGPECSIGQLHKQASEGAIAKVRKIIADANANSRAIIVGEPKVVGMLTTEG